MSSELTVSWLVELEVIFCCFNIVIFRLGCEEVEYSNSLKDPSNTVRNIMQVPWIYMGFCDSDTYSVIRLF